MKRKLTQEDRDSIKAWVKEVNRFWAENPRACEFCKGQGTISSTDPTPCPDCVGSKECPLCGSHLERPFGSMYELTCEDPDCNWHVGDDRGCDDPPNCTSWFDFMEARRNGFV